MMNIYWAGIQLKTMNIQRHHPSTNTFCINVFFHDIYLNLFLVRGRPLVNTHFIIANTGTIGMLLIPEESALEHGTNMEKKYKSRFLYVPDSFVHSLIVFQKISISISK